MKDFDDLFSERLDEEANFPNRAKNWQNLSKQLHAFDAGGVQVGRPRLQWWQAIAVVSLVTAVLLVWKTVSVQRENKALRVEIATMQRKAAALQQAQEMVAAQDLGKKNMAAAIENNKPNLPEIPVIIRETKQVQALADNKKQVQVPISQPNLTNSSPVSREEFADKNSKTPLEREKTSSQETAAKPDSLTQVSQPVAVLPTPPETDTLATLPDTSTIASIKPAPTPVQAAPKDSASATPPAVAAVDPVAALPPEIKPVPRENDRLRAGVGVVAGFAQPHQKGVSPILGQTLRFEYKLTSALWLNANADFVHYNVNTQQFQKEFHPRHDSLPRPPGHGGGGGGGHDSELVLVESSQRQQHFGLGLRYELPVRFWLQPSVRVAHSWLHTSSSLVTYKFEDQHNHGGPNPMPQDPEYVAEKFDDQWLGNQWRFGLGLERVTPRWAFGVWGDYSKNLSANNPTFDALYVSAGVQYRF